MGSVKLAVIGGGPRALWAIEELAKRCADTSVEVDVWEPEPDCGAGRVYRWGQPDYLLMNLRAEAIGTAMGTYEQWRSEQTRPLASGAFPPRREVGLFLAESWADAVDKASMSVRHIRCAADQIQQVGERWKVHGETHAGVYDELLIATGHAATWSGALRGDRVIADLEQVNPGDTVGVRGSALTFIDLMLAATIGRGGQFEMDSYIPSGNEPVLIPVNRSGLFMEVKPQPGTPLGSIELAHADALGAAIERCSDLDELKNILHRAAMDFLREAGVQPDAAADREARELLNGHSDGDPVDTFCRSIAVATGAQLPGPRWAVGEAWRALYIQIVARTSYDGRDDFPGLHHLTRAMEPLAFGPPVETARALVAAIEAGVVRVDGMGKPFLIDAWLDSDATPAFSHIDVVGVIDAVIPPPGVAPGSIVDQLVSDGLVNIRRGADGSGRGIDVNPDGTVRGLSNVSVVGRDAEDTVLGLDTLSRRLHSTIPQWAERFSIRYKTDKQKRQDQ